MGSIPEALTIPHPCGALKSSKVLNRVAAPEGYVHQWETNYHTKHAWGGPARRRIGIYGRLRCALSG